MTDFTLNKVQTLAGESVSLIFSNQCANHCLEFSRDNIIFGHLHRLDIKITFPNQPSSTFTTF